MGRSINKKYFLWLFLGLFILPVQNDIFSQTENEEVSKPKLNPNPTYYGYWNPYRRKLELKNSRDFFISSSYFEAIKNKNGKLKTVTKYNSKNEKVDSWHLVWNRKGNRSEYRVKFHQKGDITRLDSLLFSHKLSEVKPGWRAKVKSKKDGRPSRYDIFDEKGIRLYFYRFHYAQRSDSILSMETIQSSYFRSDSTLVGRHILFMENGEWLKEIHFKNAKNELEGVTKFDVSLSKEETVITRLDEDGEEIGSRIIQLSYPDKYSYKFEWRPDTVLIVEEMKIIEDTTINFISPVLASFWYGMPLASGAALNISSAKPTFGFFFAPRGNMIIKGKKYSLGMEVVSYDIPIQDSTASINGIGAFAAAQYDLNKNLKWIPQNVEAALRIGGGMLSSGYGLSLSSSFGYHFIPSRIYLGMYMQSIIAFDEVSSGKTTGWASLGISLGANVGDINPDLLKPYKDKLDEEALFFNILKEVITKSDIVFSNDYAFAIDTIITEAYSKPDPFKSILIRTPFAMTLGNSELRIILSYLNYSFDPKNISDPIFGSNAYFFGADFNLDNIFTFGGDNLNKSYDFQVGSFHSGFGISSGFQFDYKFEKFPIFINVNGRVCGLPNEEIFTGWFSYGFGIGIELNKLLSNSEEETNKDDKNK